MGLFFPNALQIWPQKGPLDPFWRSNLVPWQATVPKRSVSCAPAWPGRALAPEYNGKVSLGQTDHSHGESDHWHSESTLQKGHTDRHIALRAV